MEKSTSFVETPNPSTESKSPFTVPATDAKPESSNAADTKRRADQIDTSSQFNFRHFDLLDIGC